MVKVGQRKRERERERESEREIEREIKHVLEVTTHKNKHTHADSTSSARPQTAGPIVQVSKTASWLSLHYFSSHGALIGPTKPNCSTGLLRDS
jgi:hypothetical protein